MVNRDSAVDHILCLMSVRVSVQVSLTSVTDSDLAEKFRDFRVLGPELKLSSVLRARRGPQALARSTSERGCGVSGPQPRMRGESVTRGESVQ